MNAPARFLQIHTLHPYAASLPNRDALGRAKRISVGGTMRLRISSQARKYAMRADRGPHSIAGVESVPASVRSRNVVALKIVGPARTRDTDPDVADAVESELNRRLHGAGADARQNRQTILLGLPEIRWLRDQAASVMESASTADEARSRIGALFRTTGKDGSNIRAFREATRLAAGIDAAVFGRLITADRSANIRSALHVSHPFGVSAIETEVDYFQVMDDLASGAAAYAGETELTTGIYYGYICVDLPALVSNLEGVEPVEWLDADRSLAAEITRRIVMLSATVSPGAMRSQTAPFHYASTVLIETGESQPRQLSGAYIDTCPPTPGEAESRLLRHLEDMDRRYGRNEERMLCPTEDQPHTGDSVQFIGTVPEMAERVASVVASAAPKR